MGVNGVTAYAQYLSIVFLVPLVFLAERSCLRRSTGGEVEYVEGKNDYLVALVIAKGNVPIGRRKFEIGGYIANFCRHTHAFFD